ncbi:MAG: DUF5615 family PIN-like protein [Dehalococcoidia bacterium]
METRFIADNNVGKLARWLRLMGYDTLLLKQKNDSQMIHRALSEDRVVLTKDAQFMRRRLVTSGKLKAIHIKEDNPKRQVQYVAKTLALNYRFRPFSLCLECNQPLLPRSKEEVQDLVPARVFETQTVYTQCPACHRIYWPGTHWQAMVSKLQDLQERSEESHSSG